MNFPSNVGSSGNRDNQQVYSGSSQKGGIPGNPSLERQLPGFPPVPNQQPPQIMPQWNPQGRDATFANNYYRQHPPQPPQPPQASQRPPQQLQQQQQPQQPLPEQASQRLPHPHSQYTRPGPRHQNHMSFPPVYYGSNGLSPSPATAAGAAYNMNPAIIPEIHPTNGQIPVQQARSLPYQGMPVSQRYGATVSPYQGSQAMDASPNQVPSSIPVLQHSAVPVPVPAPPQTTYSATQTQSQSPYLNAYEMSASPASTSSQDGSRHQTLPSLRRVQSWSQLKPVLAKPPRNRRAKPEGGFMSPLLALTTYLPSTYSICDPNFRYSQAKNPRRVLTEPHEGHLNNGYDNVNSDYILYVNDILGTDENRRYLALNLLGKGTFGQVVKCQNMETMEVVAVKVVKNKPAFLNQSMMEVSILEHIQQHVDKDDTHNLLRLKDRFMHKEHLCLVFELLSSNLYEVVKKNKFRGLGINVVRVFAQQLLDSLAVLKSANLIHCDLKPENILLRRNDGLAIKVIDFGSACHERQTVYTYIQSRFYRSPEVILGLPYTSSIDMWSLGCIVAELFLGLPIFPGSSEYDQWSRIVESLGLPPAWMMDMGKNTRNFMEKTPQGTWRLRTIEEQNRLFNTDEKEGKKYFSTTNIHDTIMEYPLPRNNMKPAEVEEELKQRESLSDFVRGLLTFNPFERWTPQQAAMHPFISRQRYIGPFSPQNAHLNSFEPSLMEPSRYKAAQNMAQAYAQAQIHVQAQQQQHQQQHQSQHQNQHQQPHYPYQNQHQQQQQQYQNHAPHHAEMVPTMTDVQMAQPRAGSGTALPQYAIPIAQPSHHHQQMQVPVAPVAPPPGQTYIPNQQPFPGQPQMMPIQRNDNRLGQPLRGRSATIGQVNANVPVPIQEAAARVDPNEIIQGHSSPAYFPPQDFYGGV